MDATCTCGLLHASDLHLIILVHSTCIIGCIDVTSDTTTCTLGSESQRTSRGAGRAGITSGGILVRGHGILGGGGVAPPASAIASTKNSMASSIASSVHALFTTRPAAWRYPNWLRGISGLKGVHLSSRSLLLGWESAWTLQSGVLLYEQPPSCHLTRVHSVAPPSPA